MGIENQLHCKIRRFPGWMILFALFVLALIGCQKEPEKSAGPPEKITIAYSTIPHAALFHIAFMKGFFYAEGLDVTPQPHEFGRLALNSLLEGKADLATVADTPIMFAVTGGKKIYTISMMATVNKATAIIARKDRGISMPSDLKGKKIGVPRGTTAEFFMDSFLSTRGIGRKEVKIVDMKPNEMPDALLKRQVDAVSTWNPALKDAEKALGDNGSVFYDETIYRDIFCVAASQEFVKEHREAIRKVLKALISAETFIKQDPQESRRIVTKFVKIDRALLDEIWDLFDFKVTLDQSLLVSLEDQTRWAQENRLTSGTEMPNYLDFIYFDGLKSIKPEAVRIIR